MKTVTHLLFLFICIVFVSPVISYWWSASIQMILAPEKICKKQRRVRGSQAEMCFKEPQVVSEIIDGVHMAKSECGVQFHDRRWNCTSAKRPLRKILRKDMRETGFMNALAAAGVTYSITKGCTLGNILTCSCDRRVKSVGHNDWEWGGCGDNVEYGYTKSKEFMDARWHRRRHDLKTQILLHNYEAGRLAVRNHMTEQCQCHGLTGSCSMKTCWNKMSSFNVVGKRLKKRFNGAVNVMAGNDGNTFVPQHDSIKLPSKEDIVYSERSPDFCEPNKKLGSFGTKGRVCIPDSHKTDGCDHMCCDRGYVTRTKTTTKNCKCTFKYCCEVHCQLCTQKTTYSTCL